MDKNIVVNTTHTDQNKCIAQTSLHMDPKNAALLRAQVFRAARKSKIEVTDNLINECTIRLFAAATLGLSGDFKDDMIQERIFQVLKQSSYIGYDRYYHIGNVNFHNKNKILLYGTEINADFDWYYEPFIDANIEDVLKESIETIEIKYTAEDIKKYAVDFIRERYIDKFLVKKDVVEADDIVDTIWYAEEDGKEDSQPVRLTMNPKYIRDLKIYDVLIGKKVGDKVLYKVERDSMKMDAKIEVSSIYKFDLPEINLETVQKIGFKDEESFNEALKKGLESTLEEIKEKYDIAEFIEKILSLHHHDIPKDYINQQVQKYLLNLCSVISIKKNDLEEDTNLQVLVADIYSRHISEEAKTYDQMLEDLKQMAAKVCSARFMMFSMLKKANIEKSIIYTVCAKLKYDIDYALVLLLLDQVKEKKKEIFNTRTVNYSDEALAELRKRANLGFWFGQKTLIGVTG